MQLEIFYYEKVKKRKSDEVFIHNPVNIDEIKATKTNIQELVVKLNSSSSITLINFK